MDGDRSFDLDVYGDPLINVAVFCHQNGARCCKKGMLKGSSWLKLRASFWLSMTINMTVRIN